MTTNVLLIIIVVLLALGLFVQLLVLLAIFGLPEQLVDLFFDSTKVSFIPKEMTTVDVVDVDTGQAEQATKFKGFGNSKKSKRSKGIWSRKADKTSTEAAETKVETTDVGGKDQ